MRLILQLFILLSFMSLGQNPMSYYAPLNSDLLESIKSATASKDPVYKLSIDNQLIESKDFIKLFRLNQLEALALKRNQLDSLPSGLSQLQKLRYFQSNNPLQTFPIELGNCINLEKIVLINSAIDSIPGNLFLNPSIKHIEIHSNPDSLSIKIPNTGKTSLSSILLFSTPILEIDLNNKVIDINLIKCYINGRELWFKDLNKVKNLDLSYNQIESFEIFKSFENLQTLNLSNNQLKACPEFVAKIGQLKTLDLRGNPIPKHEIDILKILMPQCQILMD